MAEVKTTRAVRVQMDRPSAWEVVLERQSDGRFFLGLAFGGKELCSHGVDLTAEEFDEILKELGLLK